MMNLLGNTDHLQRSDLDDLGFAVVGHIPHATEAEDAVPGRGLGAAEVGLIVRIQAQVRGFGLDAGNRLIAEHESFAQGAGVASCVGQRLGAVDLNPPDPSRHTLFALKDEVALLEIHMPLLPIAVVQKGLDVFVTGEADIVVALVERHMQGVPHIGVQETAVVVGQTDRGQCRGHTVDGKGSAGHGGGGKDHGHRGRVHEGRSRGGIQSLIHLLLEGLLEGVAGLELGQHFHQVGVLNAFAEFGHRDGPVTPGQLADRDPGVLAQRAGSGVGQAVDVHDVDGFTGIFLEANTVIRGERQYFAFTDRNFQQ